MIKIKSISVDEVYLYSPPESELLSYVLICQHKHLSESFVSSPETAAVLHGIYSLTNYNDLQSLTSRYFSH